jgi:hypothetical protein
MKDYCYLVGEKQLVVKTNKIAIFRKTLHAIGYGTVEAAKNQRQ